jgi:hypothetical protein
MISLGSVQEDPGEKVLFSPLQTQDDGFLGMHQRKRQKIGVGNKAVRK